MKKTIAFILLLAAVTRGAVTIPPGDIAPLGSGTILGRSAGGTGPASAIPVGTGVWTALGVNIGSAGSFIVNGGALGTPSSGTLTNTTGFPAANLAGLGTGVATALAVNVGSAGAFVTFNGALGTPSSGTLTNTTGFLVANLAGAGTGVLTFLATPSATNFNAMLTGGTVAYIGTANAWADGVKQTFNPDATNAGINVGSHAGDPSAPANGDLWYDSSANELTARINGTNVALGSGGGGAAAYGITVGAATLSSPSDATTYYFGNVQSQAPTTSANTKRVYFPKDGTITGATILFYAPVTTGTNESFDISIRLNDTTDTTIASVSSTSNYRVFVNTGLSIAVTTTDFVEIKIVAPTWATNPTNVVLSGSLYITVP